MPIRCLLFAVASVLAAQSAHENLHSVLWTQSSAEFRAATIQTYRAAELQMMRALRDPNWTAALEQSGDYAKLPPAVILDLDETVLDNSAMQARLIQESKTFNDTEWARWVNEQRAGLLEGALDFLKIAHANGVGIFYVTNRVCNPSSAEDPTLSLLRNLGVPVRSDRLLCKAETSDKSPRRAYVARGNRILLLIGDDFNDFVTVPTPLANVAGRKSIVDANRRYWGERWFIVPNPMYGSWERSFGTGIKEKRDALRP